MPKQRFGLGRGLDALIPGTSMVSQEMPLDTSISNSALFEVPISAISPNPQQPRTSLDNDNQLLDLADSIREYGLLQPLLVTLVGSEHDAPRYQLIAGERRWRAAQLAELDRVPVVIREATPQLVLEMALIENLQRADLNPLEEARGYQMLVDEYHLTHDQIAERIGRNRPTITNTIRLLALPDEVQRMLIQMPDVFTEGHARAVLMINDEGNRPAAMKQIIAQEMSVREAEELARRYNHAALHLTPDRRGGGTRPQSYDTHILEEEFMRAVEMKVRLQRTTKGNGSLTLYFTNEEQLQILYDRLVKAAGLPLLNGDSANGYSITEVDTLETLLDDAFDIGFDGGDGTSGDN